MAKIGENGEISGKTDKDFIKNDTKIEFNTYKQDLSQPIIPYNKKIFVFNRDYVESIIAIPKISQEEQKYHKKSKNILQ